MPDELTDPLEQHHRELSRAAAAALQEQFQEVVDICSELLTSGVYDRLATNEPAVGRAAKAETRVLLATAMHYNEAPYEDIVRVLKAATDAPDEIAKDAHFTLAVVHLSFEQRTEAATSMRTALELIEKLQRAGSDDPRLAEQAQEAREFFQQIGDSTGRIQ